MISAASELGDASPQPDTVVAVDRFAQGLLRCSKVGVVTVEEADEDTGVEDRQSHSLRSASSSPGSNVPVSTPEKSASGSDERSNTTRPGPSARTTSRTPTSRPDAVKASVGIVTWCFELTRDVPRGRSSTESMTVEVVTQVSSDNRLRFGDVVLGCRLGAIVGQLSNG